jgi:hypothetical protein
MCLDGFLHLMPTAECRISTLIFDFSFFGGGLYKYPMQNILRTAKFLHTWGVNQWYCPDLKQFEVPGWVSAPQFHSRVSNINFNIWIFFSIGVSINIPMKNILRTAKFLHTWVSVKGIVWAFTWLRCLGGFLHLKPTVGCQISTLIFEFSFVEGVSMNILWKIY